jgi:hypothetical protein
MCRVPELNGDIENGYRKYATTLHSGSGRSPSRELRLQWKNKDGENTNNRRSKVGDQRTACFPAHRSALNCSNATIITCRLPKRLGRGQAEEQYQNSKNITNFYRETSAKYDDISLAKILASWRFKEY